MIEHESNSTSEAGPEARWHLRLALVSALLFLAPLALARPTLLGLFIAWAALLIVYTAILRLFGLRSVLEVTVFVFVLTICVALVLWIGVRQAVPLEEQRDGAPKPGAAPAQALR